MKSVATHPVLLIGNVPAVQGLGVAFTVTDTLSPELTFDVPPEAVTRTVLPTTEFTTHDSFGLLVVTEPTLTPEKSESTLISIEPNANEQLGAALFVKVTVKDPAVPAVHGLV